MRKQIITDRLYLRPPVFEDAHAVKSLISYDVAQWLTLMPWPYHLSDAVEWLTHVQSAPSDPIWAITRYGQIIGMIGLDGELGYWLAPEYHGKGYATEAARAVLQNYFANPYAAPLKSGYHLGNDRSANVLRKLGFAPNGVTMRFSCAHEADVNLQTMLLTPEHWHALNPVHVETERLLIDPVVSDDFDPLFDMLSRKDVAWQLGRWPHPLDPDLLRKRMNAMRWSGGWTATFALRTKSRDFIGMVGFHSPTNGEADDLSLGYALHPDHWGRGFMSEAVKAMITFLFDRFPISQILASAVIDNPASQKVLIKNGFTEYDRVPFIQRSRRYEVISLEYRLKRDHLSSL